MEEKYNLAVKEVDALVEPISLIRRLRNNDLGLPSMKFFTISIPFNSSSSSSFKAYIPSTMINEHSSPLMIELDLILSETTFEYSFSSIVFPFNKSLMSRLASFRS